MTDTVSAKVRSRIMKSVKSSGTKPEIIIRKALFQRGFRYKINDKNLPGKPDIVMPKYDAVIFYNGCFWHGHDCHFGTIPKNNKSFWIEKITNTKKRDLKNIELLQNMGWRVLVIWGCAFRGKKSFSLNKLVNRIETWVNSDISFFEVTGK